MRAVAFALLATSLSHAVALAADYDPGPLRGSAYAEPVVAPATVWEGPYFGGFGGLSQGDVEFKDAFKDLLAHSDQIRNTIIEKEYTVSNWLTSPHVKNGHDSSFGGFAGYNFQFEDVVFGFEADYTRARIKSTVDDSVSRFVTTSNGYYTEAHLSGTALARLQDYGTLRVRAGYTAGAFLPFVTAGVALGHLRTHTSVVTQVAGYDTAAYQLWASDPATYPSGSINRYGYAAFDPANLAGRRLREGVTTTASKSTFAVGFTVGAGVDVALTRNVFLRAEYQYAAFDDFRGIRVDVNTIRGGAGVKF